MADSPGSPIAMHPLSDVAMHPEGPSQTTQIVSRALVGDRDGLRWIVERFSPLLRAQARYRLRGALRVICDPEDLVQDVWAISLPRLGDLQPRDGRHTPVLVKFLATTLLNRFNTLARDHLVRRSIVADDLNQSRDLIAQLAADTGGAVTRAILLEQCAAAETALGQLSAADREIIVMRAIEQIPNKEVAVRLGIGPNTCAVRFKRAMARLRELSSQTVFDELDPNCREVSTRPVNGSCE